MKRTSICRWLGVSFGVVVLNTSSFVLASMIANDVHKRGVQTDATCLDDFAWMTNHKGQSPCTTAGFLIGQCHGGNWVINNIPSPNFHYETPNATTLNPCVCSWSVYNLLQACAFCQGPNFDAAMVTWDGYNQNCTSAVDSAPLPWPKGIVIPDQTSIPFWAERDPDSWSNSKFDPTLARSLSSEGKPDLTEESRNKKSHPAGAIAGGVVGGLVVISAAVLFAICAVRRRKRRMAKSQQLEYRGLHSHNPSAQTTQAFTGSSGPWITSINNTPPSNRPGFHRFQSSIGSTNSLPGQQSLTTVSYGSQTPDIPLLPPGAGPSGIPGMGMTSPPSSYVSRAAATHGHAYTLSNQSNVSSIPSSHDRSASEGAISPFVLPRSPDSPQRSPDESLETSVTSPGLFSPVTSNTHNTTTTNGVLSSTPVRKGDRERMNPPAYSPASSPDDRMFTTVDSGRMSSFSDASLEANGPTGSQGMSGTTLMNQSQDATVVDGRLGSHSPISEHIEEEDHNDYPADRKNYL